MTEASRLLVPYKSLGEIISQKVPFVTRESGAGATKTCSILAACGCVMLQYNTRSLRLISVSEALPGQITRVAASFRFTFAVCGSLICVIRRNRTVVHRLTGHQEDVVCLVPIGADNLVSIDASGHLIVWHVDQASVFAEMRLDVESFTVTCATHPLTYVNKILVGSKQGALRIINVKTCRVLHEFAGWDSPVTSIVQSPVNDVMAIGLQNGKLHLFNIKFDEVLITFRQQWGAVTAIAFRTDGPPVMISGSSEAGHLAVWDLEKRTLLGQMTDAHGQNGHETGVHSCFIPQGQPLLISAGADNAIRSWRFDLNSDLGTQLTTREGPALPPSCVRFYGDDGEMVLTANLDSTVRAFSTQKDTKQYNFGTAGRMKRSEAKKRKIDVSDIILPPVISVHSTVTRESEWDNVICVHKGSPIVTTWSTRRHTLGNNRLMHPRFERTPTLRRTVATGAIVTACGNFGVIAYSSGHVDVWNMQSAKYRTSLKDPAIGKNTDETSSLAHSAKVTALASDSYNRYLVTADEAGTLKIWRIAEWRHLKTVEFEFGIRLLAMHSSNNLLAVAGDDACICVADLQFGRVIRKFENAHAAHDINSMAFDTAGRCLYSSATDCTLKIWHLVTGSLIDVVRFAKPAVSLSVSPTGEYVATCHSDSRAVYLWANRMIYDPDLPLKPLPFNYQPTVSLLPVSVAGNFQKSTSKIQEDTDEDDSSSSEDEKMDVTPTTSNVNERLANQLSDMITLSDQSSVRWSQLLDLDAIRAKNRAAQRNTTVVKPKSAPFFLPSTATLDGFRFVGAEDGNLSSRIIDSGKSLVIEAQSPTSRLLKSADTDSLRQDAWTHLTSLTAGQLDVELRALHLFILNDGTNDNHSNTNDSQPKEDETHQLSLPARHLLLTFAEQLARKRDFELAHAYLGAFLKIHRAELWTAQDAESRQLLRRIVELVKDGWTLLKEDLTYDVTVLQWLRSAIGGQ